MHSVRASGRHGRAIHATAELLTKLRLDFAFLGNVARSAWLGGLAGEGSIEVLALMQPQQKNQVAMMASNRGFRVEREEIEQSEELDLIPLNFVDGDGDVRVHVLVASNALYGRMVAGAVETSIGDRTIRVPGAVDFALLLGMSGDDDALRVLAASADFDRDAFNDKVTAIGLGELAIR